MRCHRCLAGRRYDRQRVGRASWCCPWIIFLDAAALLVAGLLPHRRLREERPADAAGNPRHLFTASTSCSTPILMAAASLIPVSLGERRLHLVAISRAPTSASSPTLSARPRHSDALAKRTFRSIVY